MPQQNMQELAHALFQYIKEVCQLTQKEIFDVDKQPAWDGEIRLNIDPVRLQQTLQRYLTINTRKRSKKEVAE